MADNNLRMRVLLAEHGIGSGHLSDAQFADAMNALRRLLATEPPPPDLRQQAEALERALEYEQRRLAEHIKLNSVMLVALKLAFPCVLDHENDANIRRVQQAIAMAESSPSAGPDATGGVERPREDGR